MRTLLLSSVLLAGSLAGCATPSSPTSGAAGDAATTATACPYDRDRVLASPESAFDQDLGGGWREVADKPGCLGVAADLIRDYRRAHPGSSRMLYWHEGQLRAELGSSQEAIALFEQSRRPPGESPGWNAYVEATIAFLRKDRAALLAAREALASTPRPPEIHFQDAQGNPIYLDWPPNLTLVDGFIECFESSYAEAYGDGCDRALWKAESVYADLDDTVSVLAAIDAGSLDAYRGKDRAAWAEDKRRLERQLAALIEGVSGDGYPQSERRVLGILQAKLASFSEHASPAEDPPVRCADAARREADLPALGASLVACFTEIGNGLEFEGKRLDRASALAKLHEIDDPARRKRLFEAFRPLWKAVNGANEPDSPYRRLLALAAKDARIAGKGSPIDAAARTMDITSERLEQWLVSILETWREVTRDERVEPWDYRYASGAADRALAGRIPLRSMLDIDHRYYRDLGADPDALGVLYDLEPRPGKSSVAYTDFLVHGRMTAPLQWSPTVARVLATYRDGGLGSLNELVHENGHAVHISAIRNRPVYVDWNDDLFVEAFADVSSWSLYEANWQRRYLGAEASQRDSLKALYASVMLDVAWALFESRMLREPSTDPNALWTEITSRYLHIVPHPEVAWWAVRVQLVDLPGYMVNYGLGAVLTADLRQRIRERIGPFDTGNARWYPWLSENLLRYGSERDTPSLVREFLGRPVSPEALLAQIRRIDARGRINARE